jgi:two-component system sensor histidine kinase RegB
LRHELARCREILDDMAAESGLPAGEAPREIAWVEVLEAALARLGPALRERVVARSERGLDRLVVPPRAFARTLEVLLRNAVDASGRAGAVEVEATRDGRGLTIAVRDRGKGLTAEEQARAGEPFFTTKEPGRGMGLGLFVATSVVESLGGTLRLSPREGGGATAEIVLPRAAAPAVPA